MAGEWETASLGELCDFRAGSVFKPDLQGQTCGEFPFVKVSDMNLPANAVRIQDANNWISAADLRKLRAKPFPPGTVIFAKIGEALRQNRLRQVARETAVDNNMMGATPRINRINPRFFYYALSRFDFSDIAQGTALPYLTVGSLSTLTLDVPPPKEQRAIAHILGTLDDKIELNRKQNETLEAMARTLFKAWFVDFEPVRAKMEGRWERGQSLPGLPAHLYDLFPERLTESELGRIPAGWRVFAFSDVAQQGKGAVNPANLPQDTFTHYSLPAFDSAQSPSIELGGAIKSNKTPVPDGTVLISKLNPHIPRVWQVGKAGVNAVCSTEFIVWTPRPPTNDAFLYCLASSSEFNSAMRQLVTGTSNSHQRVKPEQLRDIRVFTAIERVIEAFSETVRLPMEQVLQNRQQSRTLAQLRDTLLPKLISGELRVPDAERIVGAAV
jgi:type I restriction enzyme S subunit